MSPEQIEVGPAQRVRKQIRELLRWILLCQLVLVSHFVLSPPVVYLFDKFGGGQ